MFDLINSVTIQSILSKYNLAPNKFLGQNFLIDENVLNKIIEMADLKAGDNVLEIGPGLGTLTEALCAKGANVVAVEKDKDLIPVLEDNLKECKNLEILNEDFLQIDFDRINQYLSCRPERSVSGVEGSRSIKKEVINSQDSSTSLRMTSSHLEVEPPSGLGSYKVVSNIPYYITSPVIRKIFSFPTKPTEIVFLVQREVAERISAPPGEMSLISLYVQFYATPKVIEVVKPSSFFPAPKVESAILKITLDKKKELPPEKTKELWRLAKMGFSSRRKTLANNLAAGLHRETAEMRELLKNNGFDEKTRAQELSIEKWLELLRVINELK